MRIVSRKRDYYDCIQAYGQDRSITYVREPKEIFWKNDKPFPFPAYRGSFYGFNAYLYSHIIGFCGKLYPMLEIETQDTFGAKPGRVKCYTAEEADTFMMTHLGPADLRRYEGRHLKHHLSTLDRVKSVLKFFEDGKYLNQEAKRIFEEERIPIFTAYCSGRWNVCKIEYNPLLAPYEFYRVFDPYAAFQELSMYIGNIAQPEKVMPVISDEMKAETHGFDKKWSFRREPGGR